MPVLVTAADTTLGRRIALRLLAAGGEVRAYASGDGEVAPLRAAGAYVAVGDLDDEGLLEAAMADVHTVVHPLDVLLASDAAVLETAAATVATAASNAGVRRLVALSLAGASPDAGDHLRRSLGAAERSLADATVPSVVIRTSLVDTPELHDALASSPPDPEATGRPVAPVRVEDLVELVAAFDALRSHARQGHAVFVAEGPETLTLGHYLTRIGAVGMVGRRYRGPGAYPLLGAGLAGPWISEEAALPDAWSFADVRPAPIGSPQRIVDD